MRFPFSLAICIALTPLLSIGCSTADKQAPGNVTNSDASASTLKTFPVHGKVVSVDPAKGSIVLDHQAVPGYMDAMTMTYKLKNPATISQLHPGDRISARILVPQTTEGYEDWKAVLDEVVVTAQARPDSKSPTQ